MSGFHVNFCEKFICYLEDYNIDLEFLDENKFNEGLRNACPFIAPNAEANRNLNIVKNSLLPFDESFKASHEGKEYLFHYHSSNGFEGKITSFDGLNSKLKGSAEIIYSAMFRFNLTDIQTQYEQVSFKVNVF
jgi:hypothetical protein